MTASTDEMGQAVALIRDSFGPERPPRFMEILAGLGQYLPMLPAGRRAELALEEYGRECEAPAAKKPKAAPPPLLQPEPDADRTNAFGPWTVTLTARDHKYTVRDDTTGELVAAAIESVTTVAGKMFPPFRDAAIVANMKPWTKKRKYPGLTDQQIMAQWKAGGECARSRGTQMHAVLEAILRDALATGGPYRTDVAIPPPAEVAGAAPALRGEPVVRPEHVRELVGHLTDRGLRPVHAELCIYDGELGIAGTFDALFVEPATGRHYLYDWKRRAEFTVDNSWGEQGLPGTPVAGRPACHLTEALVQLNLYSMIIACGMGIEIEGMVIVTIHPKREHVTFHEIPVDTMLQRGIAAWQIIRLRKGQ